MSRSDTWISSTPVAEAPPTVRWQSWPLADHPLIGLAVVGAWIALGWLVWRLTGAMHLAAIAAGAVAAAGWRFYIPEAYELNAEGINRWVLGWHRSVAWQAVGRFEVYPSGVLVLRHRDRSPMDVFWAVFVPWGENRELVLAHFRYHVGQLEGKGTRWRSAS